VGRGGPCTVTRMVTGGHRMTRMVTPARLASHRRGAAGTSI